MTNFEKFLAEWRMTVLRDRDLAVVFPGANQRHSLVKRAIAKKALLPLRRGTYVVGELFRKESLDLFAIPNLLYGPSMISFETALSYYGWIPEHTPTIACACSKRNKVYETSVGCFLYRKIPAKFFYLEAQIVDSCIIATPWRALADICYAYKKNWASVQDLTDDLRIEFVDVGFPDLPSLDLLCQFYPSKRVREVLKKIRESINGYENH